MYDTRPTPWSNELLHDASPPQSWDELGGPAPSARPECRCGGASRTSLELLDEAGHLEAELELEAEGETCGLVGESTDWIARAVARNDHWSTRLGWRQHYDGIARLLGFTTMTPGPEAFAEAVARWQRERGLDDDGIIGPITWRALAPLLPTPAGGMPYGRTTSPRPTDQPRTTSWLRNAWSRYRCAEQAMVWTTILGTRTRVAPGTTEAWRLLEEALTRTGYVPSISVGTYNCRPIRGTSNWSLHSYGIALDIDPRCHPMRRTADRRLVRFASGATQSDRCRQVEAGHADTAFTPAQVEAVEAISTTAGLQVFAWGGRWSSIKDGMHFQVNVSPAELAAGVRAG